MNRRFLGRIPVAGHRGRSNHADAQKSNRNGSISAAADSKSSKSNQPHGGSKPDISFVAKAGSSSDNKTNKQNLEHLFETSMDISFSLSSQIHSTPLESSKYVKKCPKRSSEKPTLRPVSDTSNRTDEDLICEKHESDQRDSTNKTPENNPSAPGVSIDKLQLSAWGLPEIVLRRYAEKGITTMFEWQAECLCTPDVLEGRNLVYSAPTSAGKTIVAELLMLKRILETKRKAILILPFVSVAREKMLYLQSVFQDIGVRVGGFMGSQSPPGGLAMTDLAVCTIEKANSLCNRLIEETNIASVGIVVVDELHLVGDPHRGYLLELLLTKLMFASRKLQHDPSEENRTEIQIVGMSATLPNLDLLARWLSAALYRTDYRPVPLYEYVNVEGAIFDNSMKKVRKVILTKSCQDDVVLSLCLETLEDGQSVLIFCPTKNWCEALSQSLAKDIYNINRIHSNQPDSKCVKLRRDQLKDVVEQLRRCPAGLDQVLSRVVPWGTAYHHAGLTMDERDIVEGAFRQGFVRVLVATSTLSSGVNLPARRVIVRTPIFHGKVIEGLTYRQMIGRAGRKGVDSYGESVLVCKKTEQTKAVELVKSDLAPVKSCLARDQGLTSSMKRAILEVVVSGLAASDREVQSYTSCTMLAASISDDTDQQSSIITDCIQFLVDNEIITRRDPDSAEGSESQFVATQLGSAILASSLSPDEGILVFTELQRARRCFVLENELHIIYQVTPVFMVDMWSQLDWYQYLCHWEQLSADMKRVAELVGVKESFLARAIRGRVLTTTAAQARTVAIHKRFYTALVLHDLVNEVSLGDVARKYNVNKGVLQSLQQSAATFAGMVTVFCNRLGWLHLETIFSQFQSRLTFGVQRDLVELVRISVLNAQYARVLFNAEYQTVANLAHADPQHIEQLLIQATPFQSKKHSEGEENRKRHCVWLTGRTGMTEYQAAVLIIEEARHLLQQDVALMGVKWLPPVMSVQNLNDVKHTGLLQVPDSGNQTLQKPTPQIHESNVVNTKLQLESEIGGEVVLKENISLSTTKGNKSIAKVKPIIKTPPLNRTRVCVNGSHLNLMQTPNVSILSPPAAFKSTQPYRPSISPKLGGSHPKDQHTNSTHQTTPKVPATEAVKIINEQNNPGSPIIQAISTSGNVMTSTPVIAGASRLSLPKDDILRINSKDDNSIVAKNISASNMLSPEVVKHKKTPTEAKKPSNENEVSDFSPSLYTEEMEDPHTEVLAEKENVMEKINQAEEEAFPTEEFMDSFELDSQDLAAVALMTPSEASKYSTECKNNVAIVAKFAKSNEGMTEAKESDDKPQQDSFSQENDVDMEDDFLQEDASFMDTALMQYMQEYNTQVNVAHSASPLLTSSGKRRGDDVFQEENDVHMASQEPPDLQVKDINQRDDVQDVHMGTEEDQDIVMMSQDNAGSLDNCMIDSEELLPSSFYDKGDDSSVLVDTPNAKTGIVKNLTCARRMGQEGSGLEEDIINALNMSESFSWSEVQPARLGEKTENKSKSSNMRCPRLGVGALKSRTETAKIPTRTSTDRSTDDFNDSLTFSMVENFVMNKIDDEEDDVQPEPARPQKSHKKVKSLNSPIDINNILERVTKDTKSKPAPKRKTQTKMTPKGKQSQTRSRSIGSSSKKKKRKSEGSGGISQKVRRSESYANEADEEGGDFVPPTPPGLDEDVTKTRSPSRRALNMTLRKTPKRTPKRTQGKQSKSSQSKKKSSQRYRNDNSDSKSLDPACNVPSNTAIDSSLPTTSHLDPDLPPPSIPLTNSSFSIIDVTGDRNLFHHFISEWKQQDNYSMCLACHKLSSQGAQCGIGANFKAHTTVDNDGFPYPEEELLVVGLAVAWGDVDAYYITFTKHPLICDLDGTLAAGPLDESLLVEERLSSVKSVLEKASTSSNKHISRTLLSMKDHYKVLASLGILLPLDGVLDPQVAEWMIDPGSSKKNLHRLVNTYLPVHSHLLEGLGGGIGVNSVGMNPENPGSGRIRACVEAVLCYHVMDQITAPLQEADLLDAFRDVEMPVQVLLARMEINGFGFCLEESESQRNILQGKLSALEEQAYSLAGHCFSLTSNDDISHVLFVEIGLPPSGDPGAPIKGTKTLGLARRATGTRAKSKQTFSTAKDVLEKLGKLHPLPGVILEWRRLTTILSKVVFALAKVKVYSEGLSMYRIFCLADTHTSTGRVTMTEPNIQNIPKDFDIEMPNELGESPTSSRNSFGSPGRGKGRQRWLNNGRGPVAHVRQDLSTIIYTVSMRNIFIPFSGGILVAADYSQLELRMIAHLSKDKKLINILNKGGDVFKLIAAKWKNVEPENVTSEQRQQAKQVCYGMIYGIGPKALGEQLNVDDNEASVFIETFKAQYTGMRTFLRETVTSCRNLGYVTTILRRRRYLPAIRHTNPHAKAHAERQAVNTTVQGSAADMVKKAMIDIDLALQERFPSDVPFLPHKCSEQTDRRRSRRLTQAGMPSSAYLVLQLHDELIYETSERNSMDIARLIKHKMENAIKMTVHFPVKVKIGPTWGQLQDVEID